MARINLILLIIAVVNKQTVSFSIFGFDFNDIKNVYDYVNTLYGKGVDYANKDVIEANSVGNQLKQIMSELRDMSKQLNNFVSHEDEKMDEVVKILLDDIEDIDEIKSVQSDFVQQTRRVEFLFEEGLKYETYPGFTPQTLKSFIKSVIWSPNNMEHILFNIYKIIFPGESTYLRKSYLSLTLETVQASYERLCNKYVSPQETLYYIFLYLIGIELKAFTTYTQAYTMQSALHNVNPTVEYKVFKDTFDERLTNYIDSFLHFMVAMPADIRRCDVENPVIGQNVYEMEGLFQVLVNFEGTIKRSVYHQFTPYCGDCEEIVNDRRLKYIIHNCKSYGSISGCPTFDSKRYEEKGRFSSFTADSETFGHSGQCNYSLYSIERYFNIAWCWNDLCVCSVDVTDQNDFPVRRDDIQIDAPKIMKISVEPQYSDIANNMIVVGVKFILHDDAIHLQIQQSKIGGGGAVVDEGSWKPVNVDHNNKTINVDYQILFDRRSRLYLDDVMAHPNFVVTGVKFKITKDGSGFELRIHSTEFNHTTGRLGSAQKWYGHGEYPVNHADYQRNRIEIPLIDPDDSSLAHNYHPDPQSNKFIQFQHSSIKKDAGYHTVPFFDGQPVESQMKFPLSGIGLFHRGRDGFGGYIAPRLITYNVSWFIESSFNNWQKLKNMYKDCGLEVPVNVTVFKESVDCEILKQIADRQVDNQNMSQINGNNTFHSLSQSQEIYGHENEWKQKTEKRYNENSKNTIHKKKSPCLPKHLTAPSVTLV